MQPTKVRSRNGSYHVMQFNSVLTTVINSSFSETDGLGFLLTQWLCYQYRSASAAVILP